MITAHLPAGYLVGRLFNRPYAKHTAFRCAMIGALAPDLDRAWFHLVDAGSTHHHLYPPHFYPPHWPLFWLALCLPAAAQAERSGDAA